MPDKSHRGTNVSEIATKFASKEQTSSSTVPPQGPREDALSVATKNKLVTAAASLQEDRLASATALKTRDPSPPNSPLSLSTVNVQSSVVPAPPPPPAIFVPAPPPPPPVVPPSEKSAVKRRVTKKDKKEKKKQENAPAYSLAEVVAKAKRMSEVRNRILSTDSEGTPIQPRDAPEEDPFDSAIKARVSQLKSSTRPDVAVHPKVNEESELKKALIAKSKRVSQAWKDNEKALEEMKAYRQSYLAEEHEENVSEELKLKAQRVKESWVEPKEKERSFSYSAMYADEDSGRKSSGLVSTTDGNLDSLGQSEMNEFLDSLFDPVLTHDVEDLSNEDRLRATIKGGGGVQPDKTSPSENNNNQGGGPAKGRPNGQIPILATGKTGTLSANGYPAMIASSGYPVMAVEGAAGGSRRLQMGGEAVDQTLLMAQQQLLIEQLLSNQTMLQMQQDMLNQNQQEQLYLLAQHQATIQNQQLQQIQQARIQHNQLHYTTMPLRVNNFPEPSANPAGNTFASADKSTVSNGLSTVSVTQPEQPLLVVSNAETSTDDLPPPPADFLDGVFSLNQLTDDLATNSPIQASPPPPPAPLSTQRSPKPSPPPRTCSTLSTSRVNPDNVDGGPKVSGAGREVAQVIAALEAKDSSTQDQLPDSMDTTVQVAEQNVDVNRPKVKSRTSTSSLSTDLAAMENRKSRLYTARNKLYLTYKNQVRWKLSLRKEVKMGGI